jgi:hypothetical protein
MFISAESLMYPIFRVRIRIAYAISCTWKLPQTSEISRYGSEHYLILRAYSSVRFDYFGLHLVLNIDTGWWEYMEMHEWLLPDVIQCLSDVDPNVWHVMEATTNLREAQHVANNAQAGIGMGLVESFIRRALQFYFLPFICRSLLAFRYETLDTRRAAEIEIMLHSGNLCPGRNDTRCEY